MDSLEQQLARITAECRDLRQENVRLVSLLEQHQISHAVEVHALQTTTPEATSPPSRTFSTEEKLALFRRLFQGRSDVYPVRWDSKNGRSGYAPACANEWRIGVCKKPQIKCGDCKQRLLIPLKDQVIYGHLAGDHTIGVYPLLPDDTCYFLAVDFDDANWREDAKAFALSCRELDVPVAIEISRSGNGAHTWIFFSSAVPARDVRRLGSGIISHTCKRTRQLELSSYDRLFPNQDTMPKGGFGNLIALPLQKKPREQGFSVFTDDNLVPYPDQWAFLASLQTLSLSACESAIHRATGGTHPLDVAFIADDDQAEPWKTPITPAKKLPGKQPSRLAVTLANMIYFQKDQLTQPLINRLIRLAAFQNPEFYKAQAMRFPVWDKPRIIGCAENFPQHIALPRGCMGAIEELLLDNGITLDIQDERYAGDPIPIQFTGTLRLDQEVAVSQMLKHDTGVLCAPTAFGKTVTAAALMARRGVNTLILVHRTELLKQWQERLKVFLGVGKEILGTIGGGKRKPTGKIDIAVMQSLSRQGEISDLIENYGYIVVDECHHLSAFSFEAILKKAKGKYILGLTATPQRRDGQHPIIFMQCGPVRYSATSPQSAPKTLEVFPRLLERQQDETRELAIQEVFRELTTDLDRNAKIVEDILQAYSEGRKVIVLTERTGHLESIQAGVTGKVENLFVLHGRMSKKQRAILIETLEALPGDAPRVLLSTGKLIGEGFDHPPLDSLVLAMPISWKGTLQQYAGRLHREHATKSDVRIYDYIDAGYPVLLRMWDKRQRGYKAMGYQMSQAI